MHFEVCVCGECVRAVCILGVCICGVCVRVVFIFGACNFEECAFIFFLSIKKILKPVNQETKMVCLSQTKSIVKLC